MADTTLYTRPDGEQFAGLPSDTFFSNQQRILTNTTTIDTTVGTVITNVSVIPYMRKLPIQFFGTLLRPNRQVWLFFDDKIVNNYVQMPNIIEVDNYIPQTSLDDLRNGVVETINVKNSFATVLLREMKISDGNNRIYVSNFSNTQISISVGDRITSNNGNLFANITSYIHRSGIANSLSNTTHVILQADAPTDNASFFLNTFSIVSGPGAGQTSEILAYDGVTKTVTISPELTAVDFANNATIYSIGDDRMKYQFTAQEGWQQPIYVGERTYLAGVLHIPEPSTSTLKFYTGDKIFRIVDNYQNDYRPGNYTTIAEYKFVANGLDVSEAQMINRQIIYDYETNITLIVPPTPTPTPTRTPTPTNTPTPSTTPTLTKSATPTRSPPVTPTRSPVVPPPPPPPTGGCAAVQQNLNKVATAYNKLYNALTAGTITTATTVDQLVNPLAVWTQSDYNSLKFSLPNLQVTIASVSIGTIPENNYTVQMVFDGRNKVDKTIQASSCCFAPFALVTMADGKQQPISDVAVGDKVLSKSGINTVVAVDKPSLLNRRLIGFSGIEPFMAEDHPILTTEGWGTFNIEKLKEYNEGDIYNKILEDQSEIIQIVEGTKVLGPNGIIEVRDIVYKEESEDYELINLMLDGDHTYVVENVYAHNKDPVAQTFFVSDADHPAGVFVTSIDLFFRNKGELLPLELQIRPTVNGIPSSNTIIPQALSIMGPEDVVTAITPNTSIANTATKFRFGSPIYLAPGFEYSFVLISDDYGYDYYAAEKGGTILGSDQVVSAQPFLGSLFKSQNQRTWTPIQNEDMMFQINRASFTNSSGYVVFTEDKNNVRDTISANSYYDAFEVLSDSIEVSKTSLTYRYKGVSNATGSLAQSYVKIAPDKRMDMTSRKVILDASNTQTAYANTPSFEMRVDMNTQNFDVSPVVFQNRQVVTTIENKINNGGLSNSRFVIVNGGTNYNSNTYNIEMTLTSSVGSGANVYARAQNGNIVAIYTRSEGSGYFDNVTATVVNSGPGSGNGNNAIVQVISEVGRSGGPAEARYISKTVTLLDGFDAGDLRVFMTAVKPPGSNVHVYYKVRNSLDGDPIENKNWVRMVQKTSDFIFSQYNDPIEYEFRPSLSSNSISYTTSSATYRTFNQYAIKIVLAAEDTIASKIPYVYDIRAIALPEDAY